MIYIALRDGTVRELPEAETAQVESGQLICRDAKGYLLLTLNAIDVNCYGKHEGIAELVKETPAPLGRSPS